MSPASGGPGMPQRNRNIPDLLRVTGAKEKILQTIKMKPKPSSLFLPALLCLEPFSPLSLAFAWQPFFPVSLSLLLYSDFEELLNPLLHQHTTKFNIKIEI